MIKLYQSINIGKTIFCKQWIRTVQTCNLKMNKNCDYTIENGFIWKSPYDEFIVPTISLHEHVWKDINKWHDKDAIVCGVTDRKYSYSKLRDHCAAFANNLQNKLKLKQNNVIAICLPNIPEYSIATLGTAEAGMIVTTINPLYSAEEISRQLRVCEPNLIIGSIDRFDVLKEACNLTKKQIKIAVIKTMTSQSIPEGAINFMELIELKGINLNNFKPPIINPNDICLIPFSSGTTGLPKGVMLTHINLNSVTEVMSVKLPNERIFQETTNDFQDVLPCILPFFHIYGLAVTLLSKLAVGCKLLTLPKYDFNTFSTSLIKYRATFLNLVPPIIISLTHNDQFTDKHLKYVRNIMTGAAPLGQSDVERFLLKGPNIKLFQGYGLTEASPSVSLASIGDNNYASIGYPTSNTNIKIVSITDNNNNNNNNNDDNINLIGIGPNEMGELLMRGPQVMKGYLNNNEATKEMITADGWLRTGDIAYYDNDGYFYIKDRLKELIKVKGYQVAPAELEEILRDHPKVMDAGVIGVPHPVKGEVPRAFIVKRGNVRLTEKELKEYVAKKLIEYKHLEGGVQFVKSIPKNSTGKILRKNLKQL